jgi:hypothetical protein
MEKSTRTESRARRAAATKDAIALLKADHRQVEKWFAEFKRARASNRKARLAGQICNALKVHTTIEEEIFYPAFLAATQDQDMHHEAEVEHVGAKRLIRTIEETDPEDDYFAARVKVLSEMIKHHVKEEEKPGGMFSEARKSAMDLDELGARLKARKSQLEADGGNGGAQAESGPLPDA